MSHPGRPVLWLAESHEFSPRARALLNSHCDIIEQPIGAQDIGYVFEQCDALFIRLGVKIEGKLLPNTFRCKYILCPATGTDHIQLMRHQRDSLKIISLKGNNEFLEQLPATAEHTLALMLVLLRKLYPAIHSVKNKTFDRHAFKSYELAGKNVGIIGFGRLGQRVASYVTALGARVLVFDTDKHKMERAGELACRNIDQLLSNSDIVTLHVDLREDNKDMVNLSFLEKMKTSALLINTSRGQLVNERDLIYALENKRISGAALDVVQDEPWPNQEGELLSYCRYNDNLIITPHTGGYSYESLEKAEYFVAEEFIKSLGYG